MLGNFPRLPSLEEPVEWFTLKAPSRFVQEFQVLSNRHDILMALPLSPDMEVAEDFPGDVGFERPFYK
jgi:hypothetical protein